MDTPSLNELKKELNHLTHIELAGLCVRLIRYKKENKELLSYLLFDANDEQAFIEKVKNEMNGLFSNLPKGNLYHAKKSLRKILKFTTKYIKYSGIKQTEVELLIYFCIKMKASGLSNTRNTLLNNLYEQQITKINKAISALHEDLQYDYKKETEALV